MALWKDTKLMVLLKVIHKSDYYEILCPVVLSESIRTVTALAAQNGLQLHQMDITTAISLQ